MGECNHCTWVLVWHLLKLVLAKPFLGVQDCSLGVITLISFNTDTEFSSECNLDFWVVILQEPLKLDSILSFCSDSRQINAILCLCERMHCLHEIVLWNLIYLIWVFIQFEHLTYFLIILKQYFTKVKCEVYK